MSATQDSIALATVAAQAAADKKATDILLVDVSERLAITDVFLIVTAKNERQVSGVVDGVEEALFKAGTKVVRREGDREARWVLLDFGDLIVHVFHEEERTYYGLERLWKDCPVVPIAEPAPVGGTVADQD